MNRLLTGTSLLLLLTAAAPAFALDEAKREVTVEEQREERDRTTVIDDVIRMSKAGVDDETIIRFIRESSNDYVVDADVVIALSEARVSKDVINVVLDEAYRAGDDRRERGRYARRDRNTTVYVRPYFDSWYYDPFWYGPSWSFGLTWGPRYYGGYHGGGFRHGGGHRGRRH